MAFNMPDREILAKLGTAGLNDVRAMADAEITEIRASASAETITDEQADSIESLVAGIEFIDEQLDKAAKRAASFNKSVPARTEEAPVVEAVQASAPATDFNDEGVKNVASTSIAPSVAGEAGQVIEASVTAAGVTAPTAASIAKYVPLEQIPEGRTSDDKFSIVAAGSITLGRRGRLAADEVTDWDTLGVAFDEMAKSHDGYRAATTSGQRLYKKDHIASVRRDAVEASVILPQDSQDTAYSKLKKVTDEYGQKIGGGQDSLEAANGWCAPSPPDYSICSPITTDGLLQAPEMVLNRGGLLHNQGLDFADFFGNDFVLPIPGYNILTEAQVIADTAKTCLEIPCISFVDDRLNVAALCLTGSLLQNRGYPEFVSTFVQGSTAAMAHLVNREIISAIETASTTVPLAAAAPWSSDGTVLSQVLSAVEMAVWDMRYAYRTSRTQVFDVVFPAWLLAQIRADYIRENARANNDIADDEINAMLRRRGANAQFVYDWQDAFSPGTLLAANQAGNANPITALPFALTFLVYLPGTWVIGRNDVINLSLVYDSVGLAQNQVTQVFVEDGFKPMQMCPFSRDYTINICPSGNTGDQRTVSCA